MLGKNYLSYWGGVEPTDGGQVDSVGSPRRLYSPELESSQPDNICHHLNLKEVRP